MSSVSRSYTWHQLRAFSLTYLSYAIYCFTRIPYMVSKSVLAGHAETAHNTTHSEFSPFGGNFGPLALGALDTVYLFCYSTALFYSGWMGDRLNARYLIFIGMLGSGVSVMFFGLGLKWQVRVLFYYIFFNIISGLFQSTGWPANVTVMSRWFDKKTRNVVMGLWDSHASVGNILGKILLSLVLNTQGADMTYIIAGGICIACAVVEVVFLISSPEEAHIGAGPLYPSNNYPSYQSKQHRSKRTNNNNGGTNGLNAGSIHSLYEQNTLIEQLISHAEDNSSNGDLLEDDDFDGGGGGNGGGNNESINNMVGTYDASVVTVGAGGGSRYDIETAPASLLQQEREVVNLDDPTSTNQQDGHFHHSQSSSSNPGGRKTILVHNSNTNNIIINQTSASSSNHQKRNPHHHGNSKTTRRNRRNRKPIKLSCIRALSIPGVILYSTCLFFAKFSAYAFIFWLPFYLQRSDHFGIIAASNVSIAYDVGGVMGGLITSYISEKILSGRRGTTASFCLLLAVPCIYGFSVGNSLIKGYFAETLFKVGMLFLIGVLVSGPYTLISSSVAQDLASHPALRGNNAAMSTVTGIIGGTGSLGAALQGVIVGVMASSVEKDLEAVLYMVMAMVFLSAVMLSKVVWKENQSTKATTKATGVSRPEKSGVSRDTRTQHSKPSRRH